MFRRKRFGSGYTPPAVDSPRARADAAMFLVNARSIDELTSDDLARRYRLKPPTAARMLEEETQRRSRMC